MCMCPITLSNKSYKEINYRSLLLIWILLSQEWTFLWKELLNKISGWKSWFADIKLVASALVVVTPQNDWKCHEKPQCKEHSDVRLGQFPWLNLIQWQHVINRCRCCWEKYKEWQNVFTDSYLLHHRYNHTWPPCFLPGHLSDYKHYKTHLGFQNGCTESDPDPISG